MSLKEMSKKKRVAIISLIVAGAMLAVTIIGGLIALHWYVTPVEYELLSGEHFVTSDTELIAHRGYRAIAPENTAPAFEEAGKAGFYGAECDLYMTSDGVWVVHHDPVTYRMMDGFINIEKHTYAELMEYNHDNGNGIDKYDNLKICTLDEYLDICDEYHMTAVIELKSKNGTEHYDKIIESVNAHKSKVMFISFIGDDLVEMRKLTDAPMMYLVHTIKDEDIELAKSIENCGIDFNCARKKNFDNNAQILQKCKDEGLMLGIWVVDDLEMLQRAVDLGIEYITTDCITY